MTTDEFQSQIESDFDKQTEQMDQLHEEFELKHNDFMGDVAGSPDIPELTTPYKGDPFAENKDEDSYEYVNSPSHYSYFDKEVIDVIERALTHEQFKGFLMGTSMRYRFRCGSKKGEPLERDINKAKRYEQYWYDYVKKNTP